MSSNLAQARPDSAVPFSGPRVRRWLGICRDGWPLVVGSAAFSVLAGGLFGWRAAVPFWVLAGFMAWFFRDPERTMPLEGGILAPADGRVIDVRRTSYPRLLSGEAMRISIFMSPLNVHVNRVPAEGTVRDVFYHPGKYLCAFAEKASLENEQTAIVLETDSGLKLMFVQIAGLVARRIVCRLQPGDRVQRGERFGLIKLGSRSDLYLPEGIRITVKQGDRVRAGKTIVGVVP